MLCMTPIMVQAHRGPEPHCNVNRSVVPCFDSVNDKIVDTTSTHDNLTNKIFFIELVNTDNKNLPPLKKHFIKWFKEGVLVCGSIYTTNMIASRLLLDPDPEWKYGIPDFWKNDKEVVDNIQQLGNFYFCRYTIYK